MEEGTNHTHTEVWEGPQEHRKLSTDLPHQSRSQARGARGGCPAEPPNREGRSGPAGAGEVSPRPHRGGARRTSHTAGARRLEQAQAQRPPGGRTHRREVRPAVVRLRQGVRHDRPSHAEAEASPAIPAKVHGRLE